MNYGHSSNFTNFTFYGFVLDGEEYNAVGFPMRFTESIPNSKIKQELLGRTLTKMKLAKFYQDYNKRKENNQNFLAFCRFYWFDCEPEMLCHVFFL